MDGEAMTANNGWRDIATAPRGEMVLLLVPKQKKHALIVNGKNATGNQWWVTGFGAVWPSHWMPLPAPPAVDTAEGER